MNSLFRLRSRLGLLFVLLACSIAAHAQITFTFTTTADATSDGYIGGQSYTFSFTSASNPLGGEASVFNSSKNAWWDNVTSDPQLIASGSGSGLQGGYVRPSDPFSIIEILNPNVLHLLVGSDSPSRSTGFFTPSSDGLGEIDARVTFGSGPTFTFPQSEPPFTTYFSAYAGTYTDFTVARITLNRTDDPVLAHPIYFTVSQVDISVIPEPSTYAAIAGLTALGLAAFRRRK